MLMNNSKTGPKSGKQVSSKNPNSSSCSPGPIQHSAPKLQLVENVVKPEYGDSYGRVIPGSHILVHGMTLDVCWHVTTLPDDDRIGLSREQRLAREQWLNLSLDQAGKLQIVAFRLDYPRYNNNWHVQGDGVVQVCLLQVAEYARNHESWALVLHHDPSMGRYWRIGRLVTADEYQFVAYGYEDRTTKILTEIGWAIDEPEEPHETFSRLPSILGSMGKSV